MNETTKNDNFSLWGISSIMVGILGLTLLFLTIYNIDKDINGTFYTYIFGLLNFMVIVPFYYYWKQLLCFIVIPILGIIFGCIALTKKKIISASIGIIISLSIFMVFPLVWMLKLGQLASTNEEYSKTTNAFLVLYLGSENFKKMMPESSVTVDAQKEEDNKTFFHSRQADVKN